MTAARRTYQFEAPLWEWAARTDRWTFVSLPTEIANEVLERGAPHTRGFGSLRVDVVVGRTRWRTSIFPGDETFALPVKRAVRDAEGLATGDTVHVQITLVDV